MKERIAQWKSGEKDHKQLQELRQSLKSAEESLKNAEVSQSFMLCHAIFSSVYT